MAEFGGHHPSILVTDFTIVLTPLTLRPCGAQVGYGIVGGIIGGAAGYLFLNKVDTKRAVKAIPKYKLIGVTVEDRSDAMPCCPCYACCAEDVSEITFKIKTSASREGSAGVLGGCCPGGIANALGLEDASTVKITARKGSVDKNFVLDYVYDPLANAAAGIHMMSHLQASHGRRCHLDASHHILYG